MMKTMWPCNTAVPGCVDRTSKCGNDLWRPLYTLQREQWTCSWTEGLQNYGISSSLHVWL